MIRDLNTDIFKTLGQSLKTTFISAHLHNTYIIDYLSFFAYVG